MALRPPMRQTKQTKVQNEEPIATLLKSLLPDFKNVKLQTATNALIATNLAISLTGAIHNIIKSLSPPSFQTYLYFISQLWQFRH